MSKLMMKREKKIHGKMRESWSESLGCFLLGEELQDPESLKDGAPYRYPQHRRPWTDQQAKNDANEVNGLVWGQLDGWLLQLRAKWLCLTQSRR